MLALPCCDGGLLLHLPGGQELRKSAPVMYQFREDQLEGVTGKWLLKGRNQAEAQTGDQHILHRVRYDDQCQEQPSQHEVCPAPTYFTSLIKYDGEAAADGCAPGEATRW